MMSRNNPSKRLLFSFLGLSVCVIPVTVSIFSYFPLWISRGDASILSGLTLMLTALALIPLFKYIKEVLRSPSASTVWFLFFITFFLLSRIANEITVISLVGFIGNLIGALFFRLARRYDGKEREFEG